MQFLDLDECQEWSVAHGYGLRRDLPLPEERGVVRVTIRMPKEDPPSRAVAAAPQRALGTWDEMLVWVAQTWVYRHREEMYDIDSALELAGEDRPRDELFGHLLTPEDVLTFRRILLAACDIPWFAYFLPAHADERVPLRWARLTWDGYVRVTSSVPDGVDEFAADMRKLGYTPVYGRRGDEGPWAVEGDTPGA